jgi:MFS family permease
MSYYAGYAGGSLILPALCDKNGRKKFLAGAILCHGLASMLVVALPKGYVNGVIAMFFFIGCCSSIRTSSTMCLMYDSSPKRYHGMMNSIFFAL